MENKAKTLHRNLPDIQIRVNEKDRTAEFVISTGTVDSHGTVIPIKAWSFDRYIKNPIVSYMHNWRNQNPDYIIGTSEIKVDGDKIIAVVKFEPEDINPLAEKIYQKVKAGTLRMASVGFKPINWHFGVEKNGEDPDILYFDEVELLEWSIVPVGSNPDAFKRMNDFIETCNKESCKTDNRERSQFPEKLMKARTEINNNKLKSLK